MSKLAALTLIVSYVAFAPGQVHADMLEPVAPIPSDTPPTQLQLQLSTTHDDNLTRAPGGSGVRSDRLLAALADGSVHLQQGTGQYDVGAGVTQVRYQNATSEDYTAWRWQAQAASAIGGDTSVRLMASQTEMLLPLDNFQTLVRDVVRQRSIGAAALSHLDARVQLEGVVTHTWLTNDNLLFVSNDNQGNAGSMALSWNLSSGSRAGLRATLARINFAGDAFGNSSYLDRRLAPFATWRISRTLQLQGEVALVDRAYADSTLHSPRGTYGNLRLALDAGAPLTAAVALHRDLGGSTYLASRQVETDGLQLEMAYAFTPLTRLSARSDTMRRRYSADLAGYIAHREYENTLDVSLRHSPWRNLSVGLDLAGDWRRANPQVFSFTDRRISALAILTL